MAQSDTHGHNWSDAELDLIVADYLDMLRSEIAGKPFVKLHRAKALMELTGRSHRSVEFKHMNISAVLRELSFPTIKGYRPMPNIQNAIFDAIERALPQHNWLLTTGVGSTASVREPIVLFEEEAPSLAVTKPAQEGMKRLIRKFDPVKRDAANRTLGLAGEEMALENEKRRLTEAGRKDLAKQVFWTAQEEGDGAGYDILSFEPDGRKRLLEVKTTNGSQRTPFFLSRNEEALSREKPEAFQIFRIYDFARKPSAFRIDPPLSEHVRLETDTFRASFN
jgi:hypothetical protein